MTKWSKDRGRLARGDVTRARGGIRVGCGEEPARRGDEAEWSKAGACGRLSESEPGHEVVRPCSEPVGGHRARAGRVEPGPEKPACEEVGRERAHANGNAHRHEIKVMWVNAQLGGWRVAHTGWIRKKKGWVEGVELAARQGEKFVGLQMARCARISELRLRPLGTPFRCSAGNGNRYVAPLCV